MVAVDKPLILYVNPSLKEIDIPDYTGMSLNEAKADLEKLGFKVETEYQSSSKLPKDRVISQSAVKGKKGDTVKLVLSAGRNIVISLPMPKGINQMLTFQVYINGVEASDLSLTCYPSDRSSWDIPMNGDKGKANVVIRVTGSGFQNTVYARYSVNYDSGEIKLIGINPLQPETPSEPEVPSEQTSEESSAVSQA